MNVQAPNQNGSTPGTPAAPGGNTLLSDPAFTAIHDAFQMGWSLIELKSRLQIAAVGISVSSPAPAGRPESLASSSPSQAGTILHNVLSATDTARSQVLMPEASSALQQLPPPSAASPSHLPRFTSSTSRQSPTDLPDTTWDTSVWRSTFNLIAASHKSLLGESSTVGTFYDLPDPSSTPSIQTLSGSPQASSPSNVYLPYLYLYPPGGQDKDYANVGIQKDSAIPANFNLYDVTRRSLNCLTLLCTNPDQSLTPVTVSEFQQQLLQNFSTMSQLAASQDSAAQPAPSQTEPATLAQPVTPQDSTQTLPYEEQRKKAIQLVSNQTMRYLDAWDSYARETLYTVGSGDSGNNDNDLGLVAYEAGRALSSLSWGISATTAPIENALSHAVQMNASAVQDGESLNKELNTHPELRQRLQETWLNIFDERDITSIQHQLSALSTAMDEAYYRANPGVPRQDPNNVLVRPNPNLPSQSIQSVRESLTYWQRAVTLICSGDTQNQESAASNATVSQHQGAASSNAAPPPTGSTAQPLPGAPQTQAQTPGRQGTNTGTPPPAGASKVSVIPSMTGDTSTQLRMTLIQQAGIWRPLLLRHQSLQDYSIQRVTQRIWNDFMQEAGQAIQEDVLNPVEKDARRYLVPIIVGVVVLVVLGIIVFLLLHFTNLQQSLITTFTLIVGSIVGFFSSIGNRISSLFSSASSEQPTGAAAASGATGRALTGGFLGLAGSALIEAFQNGYKQILIEFDDLNHNVSVTYPLVELFIFHSDQVAKSIEAKNGPAASPTTTNTNKQRALVTSSRKSQDSSNQDTANEIKDKVDFLIKDAYDFLIHVVWTNEDRADEISQVVRAALGPIGAFVGAQLKL